tara:strand:+ start:981 stop:4466 length:3486 start_codon:yes stop_codon:yes gene_type:complete
MKIQEIFERDIFRNINPAVVVSDKKLETIEAEIKEYVFTDELIEKIFIMVDTVLNKKSGKSGIWINGYYGSGKSHFIKFVHYLLDAETSETAFEVYQKAVDDYDSMKAGNNDKITISNVTLLKKRVESSNCDNIMFNVEDETDDGSQERLTRIFINMFNKFRGYNANDIPLAILLEKPLDEKGVFEEFKKKINTELGFEWDLDAAQVAAFQLQSVLDIAKSLYADLDIVSLHGKLSNTESFKVGISSLLIPELKAYLKQKDDSYRLLFLVDEVSQYVGANKEILLNFQNIIERVSKDCNNQVWIACTAQQSLDEVSSGTDGVMDVQDEFGKILGRFDTRISLQSSDASYITQRRVLDKNSNGVGVLEKMYNEKKTYIENQFKINHELYKGYKNDEEFIRSYPFVPYQFKLIAHVFEAFQQLKFVIKEVKDNERSVLGITHFTVKEHAGDEIGGFISFDAFYNSQFHTNLTQRGSRAIQNGLELPYVKNNPFAGKVVKVLFLISNLLENQRQTFPSNVDNLTVLLMDKLDQNKKQLQQSIQEVLDKLIDESIIREDKGSYFFFNEDEMDVQNLIKSQVIGLEDRWIEFDDIIRPLLKISSKVNFGQNTFKVAYSIGSKDFFPKGDFSIKVLLSDQTDIVKKVLEVAKMDLVICINEWYVTDSSLKNDFEWYCKTNKYFKSNSGGSGERSKTNENFKLRNRLLRDNLKATIEAKFTETRFISQQQIIEANEINGVKSNERFDNLVTKHLGDIYKMHGLCNEYAKNQAELKASASNPQIPAPILTPAEESVNTMITSNNGQMTVHDLITNFAKEPFGWKHEAVLDVLIQLVKKKKREFQYKGQPRFPIVDFINKAVSTSERMSCEVITGEDIDQTILDNAVQSYNTIFNDKMAVATDGNELFDALINSVNDQISDFQALESKYRTYPFGTPFRETVSLLSTWTNNRDPKKLFDEIIEGEAAAKELVDKTRTIGDYLERTFEEYKTIKAFYESSNENFKELSQDDQEKGELLKAFLQEEDITIQFRHAKKAFEELKAAIDKYLKDLKAEVTTIYKEVFVFLENEATTRACPRNCFADKDATINGIKTLGSITSLKNKKLSADNFKSEELAKILAAVPGPKVETKEYKVSQGTSMIKSQGELDQFITKVKGDMEKILAENKTIIIK